MSKKNQIQIEDEEEKELSSADVLKQLDARAPFSYDPNEDTLYRRYAEQYQKNAKKAMEDTLGKAATLTGGYGNSYAASAGQQSYQSHLQALKQSLQRVILALLTMTIYIHQGIQKRIKYQYDND